MYVPFDIENGSDMDISLSNIGVGGPGSFGNGSTLPPKSKTRSAISIADVLETSFLIIMWYSTFLTLYNKTLLGDDIGKFPAPLLVNTVLFSMLAIFSEAITWFWSRRFQPTVSLSWRDYYVRDGLCLSQLCRQL